MSSKIPKSHPRYISLMTRELITRGVEKGITSIHGLIAHGGGEAFDYLLGEKTHDFAIKAIDATIAMMLLAEHPVISVNGNVATLVPKEIAELSNLLDAPLEVNIFHSSKKREIKIKEHLEKFGAKIVLLPNKKFQIKYLESNRRYVNPKGIFCADVVFVPLEDGDRCHALRKNGKKVITIDLNPMSRTAKSADITIVDNIMRVLPLMNKRIPKLKRYNRKELESILRDYENTKVLGKAIKKIRLEKHR